MGRKKKICTSTIPHISQEPHECGKLSEVQIFLVEDTVKMCDQILLANWLAAVTPTVRVRCAYSAHKNKCQQDISYVQI